MVWDELINAFQQSLKTVLIVEKSASHLLLTLFCQVERKIGLFSVVGLG